MAARMTWDIQTYLMDRMSDADWDSDDAVDKMLKQMDAKAGWIEKDDRRRNLRKGLFAVERGNG